MALSRYFEGMSCLQLMSSKWTDAALQYTAFVNAGCTQFMGKKPRVAQKLIDCRKRVIHWLSLMHALGIQRISGRAVNYGIFRIEHWPTKDYIRNAEPDVNAETHSRAAHADDDMDQTVTQVGLNGMCILGPVTTEERDSLADCVDPVQVISHWVCQLIARMRMDGWINVHPAIVSRIFQELSNGTLGYSQALKVALIPFPFPFAQMLAVLLLAFMVLFPMMVTYLTKDTYFSPLLSFIGVMGLWSLNDLAVELEMPFGDDLNDLPLVDIHDIYIKGLQSLYMANKELFVDKVPGYVEPSEQRELTEKLNAELQRMGSQRRFVVTMTDEDYLACAQPLLESDLGFDASVIIHKMIQDKLG